MLLLLIFDLLEYLVECAHLLGQVLVFFTHLLGTVAHRTLLGPIIVLDIRLLFLFPGLEVWIVHHVVELLRVDYVEAFFTRHH